MISHRSASRMWGLLPCTGDEDIDVTVIGHHCRAKPRIRLHRVAALADREIRRRHGLPVTSPARTLVDLAIDAGWGELGDAVAQARQRSLVRDGELEAAAGRAGLRGARMRAFLADEGEPAITRSRAERQLRRLLKQAGLPQPKVNAKLLGMEVDFLWPEERVVLEVDGWQFHRHRQAFEADRRRDMRLSDAGYHVIRVTWRQFTEEPLALIAHIVRALDRRARVPH